MTEPVTEPLTSLRPRPVTDRLEIHASPLGSTTGNGTIGYPVRTIDAAVYLVRSLRLPGQRAVIWLHDGVFPLAGTIELGAADSWTTFAAWRQAKTASNGADRESATTETDPPTAVIDGGVVVPSWERDSIQGREVWCAPAPANAGRALYVAGRRVPRPRFPREGTLRACAVPGLDLTAPLEATLFQGSDRFTVDREALPSLTDSSAVDVVIPHFWISERLPIANTDGDEIRLGCRSMLALRDGAEPAFARYWLDGLLDLLGDHPGEWALDEQGTLSTDRHPGGAGVPRLLYAPQPEDNLATFQAVVPVLGTLVTITGQPGIEARDIRFEGIAFRHAQWPAPPVARPPFGQREDLWLADIPYGSDAQAASSVPGAIDIRSARSCAFVECTIERAGGYGIRLESGSQGILVGGCTFQDLGAGAISCGGNADPRARTANRANEFSDNHIRRCGLDYPHAVGILLRHSCDTVVANNHLHDLPATAIACGWQWDYGDASSTGNLIVANDIHHLGGAGMDWFGAIYTLGVSPGTVIRNNLIHHVTAQSFGGWGILLDPATAHVVVERNTVHSISHECLHLKTGRENIVRDNLFACGGFGQISAAAPERHVAATIMGNILIGNGTPAFAGAAGSASVLDVQIRSDLNTIWDVRDGTQALVAADLIDETAASDSLRWQRRDDQWRAAGRDRHSTIADPGVNPRTWQLASPTGIGHGQPVGPRARAQRTHPSYARSHPYDPREEWL